MRKAAKAGADYVQVGTMFFTQSHPGKPPEGPSLIKAARRCILQEYAHSNILLLGVGGIAEVRIYTPHLLTEKRDTDNPFPLQHNCVEVLRNGGDGVAVMRALSGAGNAEEAAVKLKSTMSKYISKNYTRGVY